MSEALSRWLKAELPRRGYSLSPRGGGVKQFAADTGLTPATASRTLSGGHEPSLSTLRKIGKLFGLTLGEMAIIAEVATAAELYSGAPPEWSATPPADLWPEVVWDDLSTAARWLWHTPDSTGTTRNTLVRVYQSMEVEARDRAGQLGGTKPLNDNGANIA